MAVCFFYVLLSVFWSLYMIHNGNSLPNVYGTGATNLSRVKKTMTKECNVSYFKMGCYEDADIENSSFPSLILKREHPILIESRSWSLRGEAWNEFLENFVCRCAQSTKQLKYNYFGVKSFDQCWSGDTTLYYRNPITNGCLELDMNSCNSSSPSPCAGNSASVFVYRL